MTRHGGRPGSRAGRPAGRGQGRRRGRPPVRRQGVAPQGAARPGQDAGRLPPPLRPDGPGCISSARRWARATGRPWPPSSPSSGLDDAVSVTGSVSAAELEAYYRAADVFVCASDHEGFCVPIVEAMGHGVPVVAYGVDRRPRDRRRRRPGAGGQGSPPLRRRGGPGARRRGAARAGWPGPRPGGWPPTRWSAPASASSTWSLGRRADLSRPGPVRRPGGPGPRRAGPGAGFDAGTLGPPGTLAHGHQEIDQPGAGGVQAERRQPLGARGHHGGAERGVRPEAVHGVGHRHRVLRVDAGRRRPRASRGRRPAGRRRRGARGPSPRPPGGRTPRARWPRRARRPTRRPRPGRHRRPAGERHRLGQSEVGGVAPESPRVGGHRRLPHHEELGLAVVAAPGGPRARRRRPRPPCSGRGDRRPASGPAAGPAAPGRRRVAPAAPGRATTGGTTAVAVNPAATRSARFNSETATPRVERAGQPGELTGGPDLVAGQVVVPGREQRCRRDVVVIDDQRLGPGAQPLGEVRGGGELVDEDVAGSGLGGVRTGGPGERRRLGVLELDVDGGLDAPRRQLGPDPEGVLADGVAPVEHGDELVDGAHRPHRPPTA